MPKLIYISETDARDGLVAAGPRLGADAGDPQMRTLALESGTGGRLGIWECSPGSWRVDNKPETETFYVIEGKATLDDDVTGDVFDIGPGDFVTFPKGWSGRWTIIEKVRKAYTVF